MFNTNLLPTDSSALAIGTATPFAQVGSNLDLNSNNSQSWVGRSASSSVSGLKAEYYSGRNFNTLKTTRTDATVNFDWGGGSPAAQLSSDEFSVRWTGQVKPRYSETYTFSTLSDDGIRLWVNGKLLVDNWSLHAPTENQGQITLQAGQTYDLKLEYFEASGGAVSNLMWSSPSQIKEIIPQSQLSYSEPVLNPNPGLKAEYYSGRDFNTLKTTRTDATVNFDWGGGSPAAQLGSDEFSVRWTGQVKPKYSETYTFSTLSDDGIRLWVNGKLLVDNWSLHAPTENRGQITLQAGQTYDLKLEYFEATGGAVSKLMWSSPSQVKEIIPQSQLLRPSYYVATTGNDANPGTQTAPFRTIQQAATVAKPGDVVLVQGGTYRETIVPANSGTAEAPIVFQAVPGETVSIRGTVEVPSNAWTRVSGTNIWYTPWTAEYASTNNQSDQVFVDGKMVNLARWPQETNGNLSLPRQATIDQIISSVDTGKRVTGPGYPIYRITFTDQEWDQPDNRWKGAKVWVNTGGLDNGKLDDVQDGNGQTGIVIDTNLATKQITIEIDTSAASGTRTPDNYQLGKGSYYYLVDPPSVAGLLYPNEFWHDRANDRLYLQTSDGSAPGNHTIEVKQRDYAFNLDNRSHITLQGFDIFAASITTDTAAGNGQPRENNRLGSLAPATGITLDGLDFQYVSHFTDQTGHKQVQWAQSSGVILSGSDHIIRNSRIAWSAGSGLVVIGAGNQALNNIIHDTNYSATEGGAISLGRFTSTLSQDHEIGYNTIYNTGVDGIDFSALKNSSGSQSDIKARIHHNLIHDTVLQSADSGAIKAWASDGGWTRIDHNVIYNTGGANLADKHLFFGIYLDGAQDKGEYVVDHNVVYNTPIPILSNWVANLEIHNNTLIARPEPNRMSLGTNGPLINVAIRNQLSNRGFYFEQPSGAILSHNILNATENNLWFVDATNPDPAKRNYRLVSGATAAIDQGTNAPFNDAFPPDIGAYEFEISQ